MIWAGGGSEVGAGRDARLGLWWIEPRVIMYLTQMYCGTAMGSVTGRDRKVCSRTERR